MPWRPGRRQAISEIPCAASGRTSTAVPTNRDRTVGCRAISRLLDWLIRKSGRRLARDQAASQLGLQGLTTAGGFNSGDLDRNLRALVSGGQFAGQDLDSKLGGQDKIGGFKYLRTGHGSQPTAAARCWSAGGPV